jgi:hypothetical protein
MVCQTAKTVQTALPATKQINVTNLTPSQRQELFINCLNQSGFTGFIKREPVVKRTLSLPTGAGRQVRVEIGGFYLSF